jgi:tetratricopeptide (TPR) repeat protein
VEANLLAFRAQRALGDGSAQHQHLGTALRSCPEAVEALLFRALLAYEAGAFEDALDSTGDVAARAPALTDKISRFQQLHVLGYRAAARAELEKLALTASSDAALHVAIGDSFLRGGLMSDALGHYRHAERLCPGSAPTLGRIGKTLLGMDLPADAEPALRECVRLDRGHYESVQLLRCAREMLGHRMAA